MQGKQNLTEKVILHDIKDYLNTSNLLKKWIQANFVFVYMSNILSEILQTLHYQQNYIYKPAHVHSLLLQLLDPLSILNTSYTHVFHSLACSILYLIILNFNQTFGRTVMFSCSSSF